MSQTEAPAVRTTDLGRSKARPGPLFLMNENGCGTVHISDIAAEEARLGNTKGNRHRELW